MHRSHLCSHCLRRRILLWASAFFVTIGVAGAAASSGSAHVARGQTAPALIRAEAEDAGPGWRTFVQWPAGAGERERGPRLFGPVC